MARLTCDEISDLRESLAEWRTPVELMHLVDDAVSRLGSDNLFNQGGLAFIRDAWIAAEFGQSRQADHVRLVATGWPDFDVRHGNSVESFEAVEAYDPNRRRGDEYHTGIGEVVDDPVEDWIARAGQAPAWIEAACLKKAGKCYGARANLVIYLNLDEYGIRQNEVENCFPAATETVKNSFDTVWILWKKRAYLIWRMGRRHAAPKR